MPGGTATHHLINAKALEMMKKTGIFINISRGDVVDETALIAALQSHQIAGAGLDVYEFEPRVIPALLALNNVTLLPHLGTAALEVLSADHVRTARAKGLSERAVVLRHVLRNALMPIITIVALQLGGLLAGTVLVESVFNWPGLSGMLVAGVSARDYPVVTGVILVVSACYIALNVLVDIIYGIVDPRGRK